MKKIPNPWYGPEASRNMPGGDITPVLHDFIMLTGKGIGDTITTIHDIEGRATFLIVQTEHGILPRHIVTGEHRYMRFWTHFIVEGDSNEEDT